MSAEEWRPIPGFPDYEASNQGRVRSWRQPGLGASKRRRATPKLLRTPTIGRYPMVSLGEGNRFRLHIIIARTFIGPRPDGEVIRHLDDDPLNNRPENLAYGSQFDNMQDAKRNGWKPLATHCKRRHEFTEANTYRSPSTGQRFCRACVNARYAERKARAFA